MQFEAVIFDMDGLLLDSERLATAAMKAAAGKMGIDMPASLYADVIGIPADRSRQLIERYLGKDSPLDSYLEETDRILTEWIDAGHLELKPGVRELLFYLEERGLPRAVATSTGRNKALKHLRLMDILDSFSAVVTRDDVERGKPAPDPFLRAAELLDKSPECCLVLEDSHNGVRAARAAGMAVIMVPDLLHPTEEMQSACLTIAKDLHAIVQAFEADARRS